MEFLDSLMPKYMFVKKNVVKTILLTALFALVFINVFRPFGSERWLSNMNDTRYFWLSCMLVFVGMLVVTVSRVVMYYKVGRVNKTLQLLSFVAWVVAEVCAMALMFSLLEKLLFRDERCFIDLIKVSIQNTSLILLLPYAILWLYFSWDDKNERLKKIHVAGRNLIHLQQMVNFADDKGKSKLVVKPEDLVYIKANDNYIMVYYQDGNQLKTSMLRQTIGQAERDLKDRGLVRCHRSYVINKRFVKLVEKVSDGLQVKLDSVEPVSIPISKTYLENVMKSLDE